MAILGRSHCVVRLLPFIAVRRDTSHSSFHPFPRALSVAPSLWTCVVDVGAVLFLVFHVRVGKASS